MTPPPKREDRLNPMSRRKGRPPGRPPGAEFMVFPFTVTCATCEWQGLAVSEGDGIEMVVTHAQIKHPELEVAEYSIKEEE